MSYFLNTNDWTFFKILYMTLMILSLPTFVLSQSGQSQSSGTNPGAISVTGTIKAFGELYSITGREKRRPSSTARLLFSPKVNFYNAISMDFNFLLSTETTSRRQDINRFDFHPRWRWGEARAGDFSENYSSLTLNGINIRGASLTLSPGALRVGAFAGRSNRAVATVDNNRSYRRDIFGGRLGFGRDRGTSFSLIFIKATDKVGSISDVAFPVAIDSITLIDTMITDTLLNPAAVTPQENLVLATLFNLSLADGRVLWKNEISGSANTRDQRSPALDVTDAPDVATNLLEPNVSTSFDFAYKTDAIVRLAHFSFSSGFSFLGPGYVSLGVASLPVDNRQFRFGAAYSERAIQLRFNGSLQKDNLIDQKRFTTSRNQFRSSISYAPSASWRIISSATYVTIGNDASDSLALIDNVNWVVRHGHTFNFRSRFVTSINVDYTYQTSSTGNPLRSAIGFNSHTAGLRTSLALSRSLTVQPNFNIISSRRNGLTVTTTTVGIVGRRRSQSGKLSSSGRGSWSKTSSSSSTRFGIENRYQIGSVGLLTFEVTHARFSTDNLNQSDFNETSGRLSLSRSF